MLDFFPETRGAPLYTVLFEVNAASLVKLPKSRQKAEQCCSYPELPKALSPPTQSSSVRTTTTATHFTGLINCMTKD